MRARQPLICIMERCIVIVSHSFYRSPGFFDPADIVVVVLSSTTRKELFSWRLRGIVSRVAFGFRRIHDTKNRDVHLSFSMEIEKVNRLDEKILMHLIIFVFDIYLRG